MKKLKRIGYMRRFDTETLRSAIVAECMPRFKSLKEAKDYSFSSKDEKVEIYEVILRRVK